MTDEGQIPSQYKFHLSTFCVMSYHSICAYWHINRQRSLISRKTNISGPTSTIVYNLNAIILIFTFQQHASMFSYLNSKNNKLKFIKRYLDTSLYSNYSISTSQNPLFDDFSEAFILLYINANARNVPKVQACTKPSCNPCVHIGACLLNTLDKYLSIIYYFFA